MSKSLSNKIQVTLENKTQSVAFMVHLRLTQGRDDDDVVPIFWDDNYLSLLPGERRTVSGTFDTVNLNGKQAVLWLDGWNVPNTMVSSRR